MDNLQKLVVEDAQQNVFCLNGGGVWSPRISIGMGYSLVI